jgi:NAD+ kinase
MGTQNVTEFQKIAFLAHPLIDTALVQAAVMAEDMAARDFESIHGSLSDEALKQRVVDERFDLVVTLGGDGTVLRAAHLCAPNDIPILPVNLGSLGFLIELNPDEWTQAIDRLIAGEFWFEKRMMLHAQVWRGETRLDAFDVLNDAVIARGENLRPLHLRVSLDGQAVTTYVADALVVSTPTGSTAYALAAGGPILPPELRNILIIPVAPHLSIDRAIVLAEGATVSVTVMSDHGSVVSGDGQEPLALQIGDRVDVCASQDITRLVRFQEVDYFYKNLVTLMDQNPSAGDHDS